MSIPSSSTLSSVCDCECVPITARACLQASLFSFPVWRVVTDLPARQSGLVDLCPLCCNLPVPGSSCEMHATRFHAHQRHCLNLSRPSRLDREPEIRSLERAARERKIRSRQLVCGGTHSTFSSRTRTTNLPRGCTAWPCNFAQRCACTLRETARDGFGWLAGWLVATLK